METWLRQGKSAIYSAILKHELFNFKLEILGYCAASELFEREDYYFKLLKPEYNILNIAGSSLGSKCTSLGGGQ